MSTKNCLLFAAIVAATACLSSRPVLAEAGDAVAGDGQPKYALLVGCTKYPRAKSVKELKGPVNDVPLFAALLVEKFGFREENIARLVGWGDDENTRPTCANITAGFESLVAKAGPGVQIAIMLNGHGVQVPVPDQEGNQAKPPQSIELDGLDEVFLPADIGSWSSEGLQNALRDDQFSAWLESMRSKGAHVWIVFDCCHSGTMTRGAATDELDRGVEPSDLGVPEDLLERAAESARLANAQAGRAPVTENAPLELTGGQADEGSVVAFFAAQAFEKAPELPRPAGAERTPGNYYGMLSYTLVQTLRQQSPRQPLTYRALTQALLGRYRAERGSRSPTPLFSGNMDRQVLGLKEWPKQSELLLQQTDNGLQLNGGELAGATVDSILAVFPPAGDERDADKILGHVRVTRSGAATSHVEPCAHADAAAVDPASLPHLARCRIVSQNVGDMRLKLHLPKPTDAELLARYDLESAGLKLLPKEIAESIEVVDEPSQAQWELRVVPPMAAKAEFDRGIDEPQIWLLNVEGSRAVRADGAPKVFAAYPANDATVLGAHLDRDLQRICTWQNVWRVASAMAGSTQGDVKLEVVTLKDKQDTNGETQQSTSMRPGDRFEVRICNTSYEDVWATLLFMDADFGIEVWHSGAIKARTPLQPIRATISDEAIGPEGFVVLVVPMDKQKVEPDYHFLEQQPLGLASRGVQAVPNGATSEFGRLMATAAYGKGTRSANREASDNPDILSWSWVTLPAAKQTP